MNKNQRVLLFRSVCKMLIVFIIMSFLFWQSWNILVVGGFGLGKEVGIEKVWIFGLPTLFLFYFLRLLNSYWFMFLKISDFLIYSVIISGYLALIYYGV